MALNLEQITKSCSHQQAGAGTRCLQHGVGSDGTCVRKLADSRKFKLKLITRLAHAVQHCARRIARCRSHFQCLYVAGVLIQYDEVGKCAADVHGNAQALFGHSRFQAETFRR